MEAHALREKRMGIAHQMRSLVQETGGKFTPEQQQRFDQMEADESELKRQIDHIEKVQSLENELGSVSKELTARNQWEGRRNPDAVTKRDYDLAFRGWCLHGSDRVTDQMRQAAAKCRIDLGANTWRMKLWDRAPRSLEEAKDWSRRATTAAQAIGTTTVGAEAAITETIAAVETQLAAFGGVREVANVIRTSHGGTINWPTNDDTGNAAVVIGENTAIDTLGLEFKQKSLLAFKFTSKFVKASMEFVQDAAFSAPAFIGEQLGIRVARGTNTHFSIGAAAHSSGPAGVASDAVVGVTGTTAGNITYANLNSLVHAVDPAYRRMPSTRFMMHDSSLRIIKGLLDGQNRPLWQPDVAAGAPDTILGYPYVINQALATNTTATGAVKIILFGDFSKYVVRDVMDIELVRVNERFIDLGQVAWLTFSRHDGITVAASTANWPIQALGTQST